MSCHWDNERGEYSQADSYWFNAVISAWLDRTLCARPACKPQLGGTIFAWFKHQQLMPPHWSLLLFQLANLTHFSHLVINTSLRGTHNIYAVKTKKNNTIFAIKKTPGVSTKATNLSRYELQNRSESVLDLHTGPVFLCGFHTGINVANVCVVVAATGRRNCNTDGTHITTLFNSANFTEMKSFVSMCVRACLSVYNNQLSSNGLDRAHERLSSWSSKGMQW